MNYRKQYSVKFCVITVVLLLFSSCSTLTTKVNNPSHIGNSFSGVENSVQNWRCIGQRSQMFFPMVLITWPVLAVDTITSAVGDIILLPLDLSRADEEIPEINLCDDNPYYTSVKLY